MIEETAWTITRLADYAVRLWDRSGARMPPPPPEMPQEIWAKICAGRAKARADLRSAILCGRFNEAFRHFGNSTNAPLLLLERALPFVPDSERAALVQSVWQNARTMLPAQRLLALVRAAPALRAAIPAKCPTPVTLYRGIKAANLSAARRALRRSPSWTLDRSVAERFAHESYWPGLTLTGKERRVGRAGRHPYVGIAVAQRSDILAYFDGRDEAEVVIDPRTLRIETCTALSH